MAKVIRYMLLTGLMARFCAADLDPSIIHSVMYAPVPTDYMRDAVPSPVEFTLAHEPKEICHNFRTDFTKNVRGWRVENSMQDTYDINDVGIQLNLVPPPSYIRVQDLEQSKGNDDSI